MFAPVHSRGCRGRAACFPPTLLLLLLPSPGTCRLLPGIRMLMLIVKHGGEPESIQQVGAPVKLTRIHHRSVASKGIETLTAQKSAGVGEHRRTLLLHRHPAAPPPRASRRDQNGGSLSPLDFKFRFFWISDVLSCL